MGGSDSASFRSVRRSRRPHCTPRNFMHENRETSEAPAGEASRRSAGEGLGHTARVYVCEESHSGVLPMNHSNKDTRMSAESGEGRPLIKENAGQSNTYAIGYKRVMSCDSRRQADKRLSNSFRVGSLVSRLSSNSSTIDEARILRSILRRRTVGEKSRHRDQCTDQNCRKELANGRLRYRQCAMLILSH